MALFLLEDRDFRVHALLWTRQLLTEPTHRFGSLLDHMYINFDIPGDITPVHFSQHSFITSVFPSYVL